MPRLLLYYESLLLNPFYVTWKLQVIAVLILVYWNNKTKCRSMKFKTNEEVLHGRQAFEFWIDSSNFNPTQRQRRALVLALGVCYIARLEKRENYMKFISNYFDGPFTLDGPGQIKQEIQRYRFVLKKYLWRSYRLLVWLLGQLQNDLILGNPLKIIAKIRSSVFYF